MQLDRAEVVVNEAYEVTLFHVVKAPGVLWPIERRWHGWVFFGWLFYLGLIMELKAGTILRLGY